MDYNDYAPNYARTRYAVEWVLMPLVQTASVLPEDSNIIEIGCGTGNYIISLSKELHGYNYFGFDISEKMLEEAKKKGSTVKFDIGDCEGAFPYQSGSMNLAFCVDVIHHVVSLDNFFSEANRILTNESFLIIVTDSEENMRKRSLTKFFPETLQIELDRYPKINELNNHAEKNGFKMFTQTLAEGEIELSSYLPKLEAKCSSSIRLMKEEDFNRGIERVRKAAANNEKWFSSYTVLKYEKKD
jgi:ubiquinone/menaquinone biosynthesis C-methylase UbiE